MGPVPGFPIQGAGGQGQAQGQGAAYPGQGAAYPGQGAAYPGQAGYQAPAGGQGWMPPQQAMDSAKGFAASLFDFSFTSFVTPKIIKVVYVLMMVALILGGIAETFGAFAYNPLFGIGVFVAAVVVFFLFMALWRITLEFYMVVFRMSDDIRTIKDRGGLG